MPRTFKKAKFLKIKKDAIMEECDDLDKCLHITPPTGLDQLLGDVEPGAGLLPLLRQAAPPAGLPAAGRAAAAQLEMKLGCNQQS